MAQVARLNLRMQKEIKMLTTDPPHGISLSFSDKDNFSLTSFEARIEGPEDTVYSKGIFILKIQIPERYPFQPPNVIFLTPIYHPNIDNGGRICLDILNLPPKGAWLPSLNISTVLTSIGLLLSDPNPDDGLMAEASREYKYNRQVFDQKALKWTELYAYPRSNKRKEEIEPDSHSLVKDPLEIAEKIEALPDNSKKFEGHRKKMRLSLGKKSNDNNKENMTPEIKSKEILSSDKISKASNLNLDTIIVSDSEESEDDDRIKRPFKSRLSIAQKQIAGNVKY